jgi:sugar O-acyltransferase (sialic acid O-acetyltransferase NeuD family)
MQQFTFPETASDPNAIVVYGGGGQGRVSIELIQSLGTYHLVGVIDDNMTAGSQVLGVPVLGGADILPQLCARGVYLAANAVGGIGNVGVRIKVFELLARAGFVCPNLVHPTAFVERSALLEGGVQILPKSYVSSAARVGAGTLINAGVVVSHDCVLGRCVNLSPGAMLAGGVHLEDFVQVGMAATINVNLRVGTQARIGNGATVKADVPAGAVVRAGSIWPVPVSAQSSAVG